MQSTAVASILRRAIVAAAFGCAATIAAHAQATASVLTSFAAGTEPVSSLVQAKDGNYYGVTSSGGTNAAGSIFQLTPAGTLTTLYSFMDTTDGGYPAAGLVEASDGNLYGTTTLGGANGLGTVFRFGSGGLTVLHSFDPDVDGNSAYSALIVANDGNLYGILAQGAYNSTTTTYAGGTIFQVTTAGVYTNLASLPANGSIGVFACGRLLQATDGNFWGTTSEGATNGYGTVFYWNASNGFTVVHNFTEAEGQPLYGLTQYSSYLWGTTFPDGLGNGEVFSVNLSSHAYEVVYSFTGGTSDGGYPATSLLAYTDGYLYGATQAGGANGSGTIFRLQVSGTPTTVYNMPVGTVSTYSDAALLQASNTAIVVPLLYDTTAGLTFNELDGAGDVLGLVPQESSSIPAPVDFTTSASTVAVGQNVTLTWSTPAADSLSGQQCYAFSTPATPWTGVVPASGSLTGPLNNAGTFTFSLTCGGSTSTVVTVAAVNQVASTTSLTVPATLPLGQVITFSSTVTGGTTTPTGTVAFLINGQFTLATQPLVNGTATFAISTAAAPAGNYTVQAVYSGDAAHLASSSSVDGVQLTNQAATTTVLTAAPQTLNLGQNLTLTATVTSGSGTPTGQVQFLFNSLVIGTATLNNGSASISGTVNGIPVYTYGLHAQYLGTSSFAPSTSPICDVTLNQ